MSTDKRNNLIVAFLIASMTLGAAVLLWLEPPTRGWSSASLLMAECSYPIRDVRIDYADNAEAALANQYDCVVRADGSCEWHPMSDRIGLLVIGSPHGSLSDDQSLALLAVLGAMNQRHKLALDRIWLDPVSDARLHPELSPAAHELVELLVRKSIIQ